MATFPQTAASPPVTSGPRVARLLHGQGRTLGPQGPLSQARLGSRMLGIWVKSSDAARRGRCGPFDCHSAIRPAQRRDSRRARMHTEGSHRAASGSLLGGPCEGGGGSSGGWMQLRRRSPEVHSVLGAARPMITDFQTRHREGDVLAGCTQLMDVGARMHLLPGSGAPGPGFRP